MSAPIVESDRSPAGFFSYARADDEHDGGHLTQLRRLLQGELEAQSGEAFVIFQDREHILWGHNWQARIRDGIDAATVLIPIVTPRFFKSSACRAELSQFLERERQLGRQDLVFPLYYISTPLLDDNTAMKTDELAMLVSGRHYRDWRDNRFEDLNTGRMRREFVGLAQDILLAVGTTSTFTSSGPLDVVDDDRWSDEKLGLVEQMAAVESALDSLPPTLDAMTDVLRRITVVTNDATEDTRRANRAPKPAAAKLHAAHKQRARLEPLVAEHDALTTDYKELVEQLDLGQGPLLDRVAAQDGVEREQGIAYARSVLRMSNTSLHSVNITTEYIGTLEKAMDLSSTVRPIYRQMIASCKRLLETESTFERWASRSREVLYQLGAADEEGNGQDPSPGQD